MASLTVLRAGRVSSSMEWVGSGNVMGVSSLVPMINTRSRFCGAP